MKEKANQKKEQAVKEESLRIQNTDVRLEKEEENLGIGYEIVINSENR